MRSIAVPGLVAVVAVGLAIAAPWAGAPAFAAAHPGTDRCVSSQFHVRLTGRDRDNTDLYRHIEFTNTGRTCVLRGRPAVSVERGGHRVGAPGAYFPYSVDGRPPVTGAVRVVPHGRATIWLAVAPAGGSSCRRERVDAFRVALPATGAVNVAIPVHQRSQFAVCASPTAQVVTFSQFLPARH